jgi:alpha-beta hydrolase superfamily lysophospholipase
MTELPIVSTFKDSHGVEITFYEWPVAKPKAVVQIAHGLGEHARRWDDVAAMFNRAGYKVYADDHRGHGLTGKNQVAAGQTKTLGNLGPGGLPAAYEQVHEFTQLIRDENPTLPLVLLGHSYGSFITQKLIKAYSADYDAVVISGSAILTPTGLNPRPLNAKWSKDAGATGFEWLSRDPKVGAAFSKDPLTFYADPIKLFGLRDALKLYHTPKPTIRPDLPLLILVGADDPVGGLKSNKALADAYVRAGLDNVTFIAYDDARHEVFNETNKQEVNQDTLSWLTAQLG